MYRVKLSGNKPTEIEIFFSEQQKLVVVLKEKKIKEIPDWFYGNVSIISDNGEEKLDSFLQRKGLV